MKRLLKCSGALHMSQISSTAKGLSQIINNFYCSKFLSIYNILAEYHFYHASASQISYLLQSKVQLTRSRPVLEFMQPCNNQKTHPAVKVTPPRTPRISGLKSQTNIFGLKMMMIFLF